MQLWILCREQMTFVQFLVLLFFFSGPSKSSHVSVASPLWTFRALAPPSWRWACTAAPSPSLTSRVATTHPSSAAGDVLSSPHDVTVMWLWPVRTVLCPAGSDCTHRHSGPVWQVRWVVQNSRLRGDKRDETLISVSADGRIKKWFINKGFECKGTTSPWHAPIQGV